MQINLKTNISDIKKEFSQLLLENSSYIKKDVLDCSISWTRQSTDKELDFILDKISSKSLVGIKIITRSAFKINKWEMWDGGYIEGFVYTMTNPDYIIWTYIKMNKSNILKEFLNKYSEK